MAYYVSSGQVSSGIILTNDSMYVSSGGTANSTTINTSGSMFVSSGGTANYTVGSGAWTRLNVYGLAISNIVNDQCDLNLYDNGIANITTVNYSGTIRVYGGTAKNTTVNSSGRMYVNNGGLVNIATVNSGGSMYVESGGTATSLTISSGGILGITIASNTYIQGTSAGSAFEMKNAYISGYTVNSGGSLVVSSGGTATAITASSGGILGITVASNTYIQGTSAGSAFEMKNAYISGFTVNSYGSMFVLSGGTADYTVGSGAWTRLNVYGLANSTIVNDACDLNLYDNGIANVIIVNHDGTVRVYAGGTANSNTINSSGRMYVYTGGTANCTTVNSEGSMFISGGGTATELTVSSGGVLGITVTSNTYIQGISAGSAFEMKNAYISGFTVSSGGSIIVSSGGTATALTVSSGGVLGITVASNTYIQGTSAGSTFEMKNAFIAGHIVYSDCYMHVSNGGTANNITVSSGGSLVVSSGGKLNGTLEITSSAYVSAFSGSIIDFDISAFNGSSTARVNNLSLIQGTPTYTITVAGDQTAGIYTLAGGASGFTGTLSIGTDTVNYGTVTVNGEALTYDGSTYTLATDDGNLFLTIADAAEPDDHIISGLILINSTYNVSSGYTTLDADVSSGGSLNVVAGGMANSTTVNSSGTLIVSNGGTATGITINSGGGLFLSGGYAESVTARNDGSISIGDQGVLSNVTFTGRSRRVGGDLCVSAGGKLDSAAIGLYGDLYLFETGEAHHAVVQSGGILYCGFNDEDWGQNDAHRGSRGGIAYDTTLESGGSMRLYASGSASNVAVNSGATLTLSGGIVDKATVNSGGSMAVSSGGTAQHASVYCANMAVFSSGFVENAVVEASPGNHGWLVLYDGGTTNNTTVKSSGHQEVSSGGIAANAMLISGGGMGVSDGGFAYNTTVSDWWSRLKVYAGGTASDTIVNTSGSLYIYSTGKHTGSLQIAAGANIQASSGSIIDFDISKRAAASPSLINNLSLIQGKPDYTITVDSAQASGTYKLAENASGFNSTVTLTVGDSDYANVLTVGNSYTINGKTYTLGRDTDNTLILTVGASNLETPALIVTTASDVVDANDGMISLREAIAYAANGTRAADGTATITFAESLGEEISISLDVGTVNIASGTWNQEFLTIDGGSRAVIHAGNATSVLFRIENNNQVNIKNLTFSGDSETINPHETPVIFNLGTLLAENLEVVNNKTTGYCPGIWTPAGGNTTIRNCQFIGNLTNENSGAVRNENGYVLIEDSLFRNNVANRFGGAIHNVFSNAEMVVRNTVFENNSAVNGGGAIYNFNNAQLTVDGCIFKENAASWGNSIWNGYDATSTVTNSHFYGDNTDAVISFSVSGADVSAEKNQLTAKWDQVNGVTHAICIDRIVYDTETPAYSGVLSSGNHEVYVGHKDSAGNYAWSDVFTFEVEGSYNNAKKAGDLNMDGRADIIMTIDQSGHPADGSTGAWLIQAEQTPAWGDLSTRGSGWVIFGTGKTVAGKNTDDVYIRNVDNVIGAWTTGDDGKVNGWETIGEFSNDTQVVGLGDFNGNGQTDLLLRNSNGAVGCFFTGGEKTGWNYFQSLGDEWKLSAVGDLNGDGRDDVVLKHDAGFAGSWLTQSDGTVAWADLDTLPYGFEIVGAGDFNGDGTDDVLLKSGNYYGAWLVNDGNAAGWLGLGNLGDVTVEQIADFNGDGVDDLRIRTSAGDIGVQLVMAADTLDWHYYGSVGAEWKTGLAALS